MQQCLYYGMPCLTNGEHVRASVQDKLEGRGRRGGVDGRLIKAQIKKQLLPPDSDEGVVSDSEDEHVEAGDGAGLCDSYNFNCSHKG